MRRLRLNLGLQALLNECSDTDFEELLFWGRVSGLAGDYYIATGVTYTHQYEFPTKTFYFASSRDFAFRKFRDLNDQHRDLYENFARDSFSGDSNKMLHKIDNETDPNEAAANEAQAEQEERDPLEDTPPEDPNKGKIFRSMIEEDRLFYTVLAIENDCQICPHGSFRLNEQHEVERNVAFRGLSQSDCFSLARYSHFRNVQDAAKKELLLEDDAIFQPNFLDEVATDLPIGGWCI